MGKVVLVNHIRILPTLKPIRLFLRNEKLRFPYTYQGGYFFPFNILDFISQSQYFILEMDLKRRICSWGHNNSININHKLSEGKKIHECEISNNDLISYASTTLLPCKISSLPAQLSYKDYGRYNFQLKVCKTEYLWV